MSRLRQNKKKLELDKEIEFIYILIEMLGLNGKIVKLCVQTLFVLLSILIEVAELCKKPGGDDFDKKIMVDLDHLKEYPYCGNMFICVHNVFFVHFVKIVSLLSILSKICPYCP